MQFGATTKHSAEAQPEEFQLDIDGDTVPDADLNTASASASEAMSADAQAIIAALNLQIAGANSNIQGLSSRVDAQFAAVDRRMNGREERFRALDGRLQRVEVSGGGGAASMAGSAFTAAGASSADVSTTWASSRPNLGPVLTNPYASRPQENSVDAEDAKPIKKRRLIRIGGSPKTQHRKRSSRGWMSCGRSLKAPRRLTRLADLRRDA